MTTTVEPSPSFYVMFEADFSIRTGPRMTDYSVMTPGSLLEVTDEVRAYNPHAPFDLDPATQRREFKRVLLRRFDGDPTVPEDPRVARWYAPSDGPRYAEVDQSIPVTSRSLTYYENAR